MITVVSLAINRSEITLKLPLMPLGVDHWSAIKSAQIGGVLKLPLMPLGVDHFALESQFLLIPPPEITFDAVRR